jgi:hypothetical protein
MHISKSRRPVTPCLVERCPHCRRTGEFWLIELAGQVGPFFGTGFSLACGTCNFEKLLSDRDAKKLSHLATRYRQFTAGEISPTVFDQDLAAANLRAIEEIQKESLVWICPKCQEENPPTFDSCWNCGGESPAPTRPADDSPPQLPEMGGKLPWE